MELARENMALKREAGRGMPGGLIGASPVFTDAVATARRAANSDATVLILGETGTGKELIAREIHSAGGRSKGPFLALNCGALPENLLERELFGHERGAFTGADATTPGLLEAASDGVLLLDEILEMSLGLQVKLLRVLDGHEFLRLGGTRPIRSRVRFLAATNQDPVKAVADRRFREDLFFRLNVLKVSLPPLRERGDDILMLADHFLAAFARSTGRNLEGYSPEARRAMQEYPWPGNVRELKNVVERAVILCEGPKVEAGDLRLSGGAPEAGMEAWLGLPFREAKKRFEEAYLKKALKTSSGNISRAAESTGIDRKNLKEKIREYGFRDPE